jgi:alanyl-tRNA synthetase
MKAGEIRKKYLDFFKEKGHSIIPSASLVPENDPTTLFTGSGMQPLIPYLLGQAHPMGKRLVNSQKSFRAQDIEEVGDNRHTTFFEMLGNWSLGDYFKQEQLPWFFEFLCDTDKGLGLDPLRLYVTVFSGDPKTGILKDEESIEIWKKLFAQKGVEAKDVVLDTEEQGYEKGMQGGRIFAYGVKKNWWSRSGVPSNMPQGEPGGPDSEVFYDFELPHDKKFGKECHPNCDCGRFLEIGNSVFMEYKKTEAGFEKLSQRNVDFGGGLERLLMAHANSPDIIAVNHRPIVEHLEQVSGKRYGAQEAETRAFRIVADHMKAAVFLIADGVHPSNTDQGYFVRRLIRRSVRYADMLGIEKNTFVNVVRPIAEMYKDAYAEVAGRTEEIESVIAQEENRFRITLKNGLKELEKMASDLTGEKLFDLYQTYGFPIELSLEIIGASEDVRMRFIDDFQAHMKQHQELSRTASAGKFKGGLADTQEATIRLHTAHHLLLAALQHILGDHVKQKGSNITAERLRIDFSHPAKLTQDELQKVENLVNEKIQESLDMVRVEMKKEEALKIGAQMEFGVKYGDVVSVYFAKDQKDNIFSKEFCGGPHVNNTKELGRFRIMKEEAVAAGIRRIRAVLE